MVKPNVFGNAYQTKQALLPKVTEVQTGQSRTRLLNCFHIPGWGEIGLVDINNMLENIIWSGRNRARRYK